MESAAATTFKPGRCIREREEGTANISPVLSLLREAVAEDAKRAAAEKGIVAPANGPAMLEPNDNVLRQNPR